jgi:hypothetical protein
MPAIASITTAWNHVSKNLCRITQTNYLHGRETVHIWSEIW